MVEIFHWNFQLCCLVTKNCIVLSVSSEHALILFLELHIKMNDVDKMEVYKLM